MSLILYRHEPSISLLSLMLRGAVWAAHGIVERLAPVIPDSRGRPLLVAGIVLVLGFLVPVAGIWFLIEIGEMVRAWLELQQAV